MTWKKLIKKDIDSIVEYINKESIKYISFSALADELEADEVEIIDYLQSYGYIKKKNTSKFVKSMFSKNLVDDNKNKDEAMKFLIKELDTIKEVVEMYKKKDINDLIKTELPVGEIKATTIRVNKTVWDKFDTFSEDLDYTKHELISLALLEFIDKYS